MSIPDVVSSAISKCPFLHELAVKHGDQFARSIAIEPTKPAVGAAPRPLLEEVDLFHNTFNLFHGKNGVVPLRKSFAEPSSAACEPTLPAASHAARPPQPAARLPVFASMTMSMGPTPDPGHGRDRHRHQQHNHDSARRDRFKPTSAQASGSLSAAASTGGCPLRRWLGPLAPYVFNSRGSLQCPEPIIQMRASLARTAPVRNLRPKGLPIKLAAVGATAAVVNVPCGAIREHFEKFSPGWFIAVHASIPFVAMLRKAVVMPKVAIAMTIAAAIFGQVVGSRLERARLAKAQVRRGTRSEAQGLQGRASFPKLSPEAFAAQLAPKNLLEGVAHRAQPMFAHLSAVVRVA